jgi:hypothetical protein
MKKVVQQLVVLGTGEVRLPQGTGKVAHGHRSPDQHISIVMPPRKNWLLVELQIEVEDIDSPDITARAAQPRSSP